MLDRLGASFCSCSEVDFSTRLRKLSWTRSDEAATGLNGLTAVVIWVARIVNDRAYALVQTGGRTHVHTATEVLCQMSHLYDSLAPISREAVLQYWSPGTVHALLSYKGLSR